MTSGILPKVSSVPLVRSLTFPAAKSTSSSSPSLILSVSHISTGSPRLIALRKKILATLFASMALTPAILITSGACSRDDPSPKLLPPTTKSPSFTFFAKLTSASSRTCWASSGRLLRRWAYRPGMIWSVEMPSPNLWALPLSTYITSRGSVISPVSAEAAAVAGLAR